MSTSRLCARPASVTWNLADTAHSRPTLCPRRALPIEISRSPPSCTFCNLITFLSFFKYLVKPSQVEDNWWQFDDRKDESNRTCGDLKASYPIRRKWQCLPGTDKQEIQAINRVILNRWVLEEKIKRNIRWRLRFVEIKRGRFKTKGRREGYKILSSIRFFVR